LLKLLLKHLRLRKLQLLKLLLTRRKERLNPHLNLL
jgi:hypothetical protein